MNDAAYSPRPEPDPDPTDGSADPSASLETLLAEMRRRHAEIRVRIGRLTGLIRACKGETGQ